MSRDIKITLLHLLIFGSLMLATIDSTGLLLAFGLVLLSMYIIKYACDAFEDASDYLGTEVYKMAPGVRGATLEAVASSLPELFTTLFLLFIFHDQGGFAAGVATCAGSAVFDAVVIPAVCILAVTIKGVDGTVIDSLLLKRSTIVRDGFFFILAEICLIIFLGTGVLTWWMGLILMGLYGVYFAVLIKGFGQEDEEEEEDKEEDDSESNLFIALLSFDFNQLLFGGRDFTTSSAWTVLSFATLTIAGACYILSESVMLSAESLGIAPYFTAVILGAAATSVPDTILSYKDAMKGDYDDAVANAVGSNIFDICVALGLPLVLYTSLQMINGSDGYISMATANTASDGDVQTLRIVLIGISIAIVGLFLVAPKEDSDGETVLLIGKGHGFTMLGIYGIWTGYILMQIIAV